MSWIGRQESLLGSKVVVDSEDIQYLPRDGSARPRRFEVLGPSPCPWAWNLPVSKDVEAKASHVFDEGHD
eukprot:12880398-Prorocentrum_lima.AAC.1